MKNPRNSSLTPLPNLSEPEVTPESKEILNIQLYLYFSVGVLYYFTATINPIIYNLTSIQFRKAFKQRILGCYNFCSKNHQPSAFTLKSKKTSTCVVFKAPRRISTQFEQREERKIESICIETLAKNSKKTSPKIKDRQGDQQCLKINEISKEKNQLLDSDNNENYRIGHTQISIKPILMIKIDIINSEKNSSNKQSGQEPSQQSGTRDYLDSICSPSIDENNVRKPRFPNSLRPDPSKTESSIVKSERSYRD